ncbi:MAG: 2Fe-2S iron-sulfur cluster-binding protein [Natronomonas sp.]
MSETHRITLLFPDDRSETLTIGTGETILDAAEAAGFGLPYGCLTGACGTCTAECLDGELRHERQPRALKERHLDAGYALLCIATAESDCRLRVGADIQAELVEDPWR